jgi:hypothetical protein
MTSHQNNVWPVVRFDEEFCDVYIGHPSKWGSPFRVGPDGSRDEVMLMYENWLLCHPKLIGEVCRALRGKILGCHCAPLPCHGDVLARIANNWQLALPLEL